MTYLQTCILSSLALVRVRTNRRCPTSGLKLLTEDHKNGSLIAHEIIVKLYLNNGATPSRKSLVEIGNIYFWTATINNWYKLLVKDEMKEIIISSLQYLYSNRKIEVYAFVVMPNHVHFIWQMLEINGKEMPHTSFLKFTAHSFQKYLKSNHPNVLKLFAVDALNKNYEFWQRDSLAFELTTRKTISQKIDYIHYNPTNEHWKLSIQPAGYFYSSAKYYECGIKNFEFLTHIGTVL